MSKLEDYESSVLYQNSNRKRVSLSPDLLEKLIQGFDYFDKDKNGEISINEIPELLDWLDISQVYSTTSGLIEKMDTNKDGIVDLDEFLAFVEHLVSSGSHKENA